MKCFSFKWASLLLLAAFPAFAQTVFSSSRRMQYTPPGYGGAPGFVTFLTDASCNAQPTSTVVSSSNGDFAAACAYQAQWERNRLTVNETSRCFVASSSVTQVGCSQWSCSGGSGYGGGCGYVTTYYPVCNITVSNAALVACPSNRATSTRCGYVNATWNVPPGAALFYRWNNSIKGVIDAIGEYYTHVAVSLGTAGAAHAAMYEPTRDDVDISYPDGCYWPIKEGYLRYAGPGAQQVSCGGAYSLFLDAADAGFRRSPYGPQIANWLLNMSGKGQVPASPDSYPGATVTRLTRNGSFINYGLYQYRNIEGTHLVPSSSTYNGMTCSSFMAYVHAQAGAGTVQPYTYGQPVVGQSVNTIFNLAHDECRGAIDGFWPNIANAACDVIGENVCWNAGSQVANCFIDAGACGHNSTAPWTGFRDDPASTAFTISPDRIAGRAPHQGASTWANSTPEPIYWNGPGVSYGCW